MSAHECQVAVTAENNVLMKQSRGTYASVNIAALTFTSKLSLQRSNAYSILSQEKPSKIHIKGVYILNHGNNLAVVYLADLPADYEPVPFKCC